MFALLSSSPHRTINKRKGSFKFSAVLVLAIYFFFWFVFFSSLLYVLSWVKKCFNRAKGELEVVRHRLEALSREKDNATVGASAKIAELEAKVQEGELQRRKMHNLIQASY